jgi:thioredoxin 1
MLPVLGSVANRFAGKAKVGKVDITEEYDLANEYGVYSVPRFLLFHKNKKPSQQILGPTSEAALEQLLRQVVET